MAGLIARLFGGGTPPVPTDQLGEPQPGVGGYTLGPGPDGESGFPGSTSATRTFKGSNQRPAKIDYDSPSGADVTLTGNPVVRQVSAKFGTKQARSPRQTPSVVTPQDNIRYQLQNNSQAEFYGGQPLKTRPGFDLAGQNPLSGAERAGGHNVRDTETPATQRQPNISGNVPGSQNVRNTIAERYKNPPGQSHTYNSAPRADQGHGPGFAATSPVTVQNRYVWDEGGVQSYSMLRQMPYTGRGDGARGAALNGQRYYGEFNGSGDQFLNAGQGSYGIGREQGPLHRPTQFTEPAPWSSQYLDTTSSVGTADSPGPGGQSPSLTYMSPEPPRNTAKTPRG